MTHQLCFFELRVVKKIIFSFFITFFKILSDSTLIHNFINNTFW